MESEREEAKEPEPSADWAILVAHDVRNLLSGAAGMTELLEAEGADPMLQDRLRAIRHQIGHAANLLEDLIVRGLVRLPSMEAVDLGVVALGANAKLLAGAGRSLRVERIEPEERTIVYGRVNDLERALCNLMWNALEAMRRAGTATPRLDLRWGCNREGAFLEVRDYGPGLPQGKIGSGAPGRRGADGWVHGLGIASVRHVMAEHGGRLIAENEASGIGAVLRLQFGTQRELEFGG